MDVFGSIDNIWSIYVEENLRKVAAENASKQAQIKSEEKVADVRDAVFSFIHDNDGKKTVFSVSPNQEEQKVEAVAAAEKPKKIYSCSSGSSYWEKK